MTNPILVIADVHSNLTALNAVMADVERNGGSSEIWCLGDVVGYGSDPLECVRFVRDRCIVCVAGNHDLAAAGKINTEDFNANAAEAIAWTAQQLSDEDRSYLGTLPQLAQKGDFTIVHGSPLDPVWEYVSSLETAAENFAAFPTRHCLVGHTHIPVAFEESADGQYQAFDLQPGDRRSLGESRLILNPGAVGQPRDGDPRASYAILDLETQHFTLYRVPYDIAAVQSRMRKHGLPPRLIDRLSHGI